MLLLWSAFPDQHICPINSIPTLHIYPTPAFFLLMLHNALWSSVASLFIVYISRIRNSLTRGDHVHFCPPLSPPYLSVYNRTRLGGPIVAQRKQTPLVSMRMQVHPWPHSMGEGSSVAVSSGVGCRCGWDPTLLWLQCRLVATALIQPHVGELHMSRVRP